MGVIPSDIVNAYKSYLFANKETSPLIDHWPSTLPVNDLDHDIGVLQLTIFQLKKFGMDTQEQENQLAYLNTMNAGLQGSKVNLPGLVEKQKAKTLKAVAKQKKSQGFKNYYTGKTYNNYHTVPAKQTVANPVGVSGGKTAYSGTVPVAKPFTQLSAGKEVGVKLSNFKTLEQSFIMRVGMMSNCNVSIQQYMDPASIDAKIAMRCDVCKTVDLVDLDYVANRSDVPVAVRDFCTAHRHDPEAVAVGEKPGRFFREDE